MALKLSPISKTRKLYVANYELHRINDFIIEKSKSFVAKVSNSNPVIRNIAIHDFVDITLKIIKHNLSQRLKKVFVLFFYKLRTL